MKVLMTIKDRNLLGPVSLTVGDKGRITLSEQLRNHLGIAEGDLLYATITGRATIEIGPAAIVPRDQAWFVHPSMRKRLAEAHADLAAGRVTRAKSAKELRAQLARVKRRARAD